MWEQLELWPIQVDPAARPKLRLLEPGMPLDPDDVQLDEDVLRSWPRYRAAWRPVLIRVCQGMSNPVIARELEISVYVVKEIIRRLFDCSGADSRVELAHLAQAGRRSAQPTQPLRAIRD